MGLLDERFLIIKQYISTIDPVRQVSFTHAPSSAKLGLLRTSQYIQTGVHDLLYAHRSHMLLETSSSENLANIGVKEIGY